MDNWKIHRWNGFLSNIQICKLTLVSTNCDHLEAKIFVEFWTKIIKHNTDRDYNKHELSGEISYAKIVWIAKIKPQNWRFWFCILQHLNLEILSSTFPDLNTLNIQKCASQQIEYWCYKWANQKIIKKLFINIVDLYGTNRMTTRPSILHKEKVPIYDSWKSTK